MVKLWFTHTQMFPSVSVVSARTTLDIRSYTIPLPYNNIKEMHHTHIVLLARFISFYHCLLVVLFSCPPRANQSKSSGLSYMMVAASWLAGSFHCSLSGRGGLPWPLIDCLFLLIYYWLKNVWCWNVLNAVYFFCGSIVGPFAEVFGGAEY